MKLRKHDKQSSKHEQWYSRGYIPHFDSAYHPQLITYRLADPMPQEVIRAAQKKYRLQEWVVMPNHVHALYDKPLVPMKRILHSWRSYTANEINAVVGREGR